MNINRLLAQGSFHGTEYGYLCTYKKGTTNRNLNNKIKLTYYLIG